MRTFEWPIEDILVVHPGLYLEHHAVMAVALMSRLSESPCEFLVECEGFRPPGLEGEPRFLLRVSWDEPTALPANQMLDNPRHWNGYVFVCCFAEGQRVIRWSYHMQEGQEDESS